MDEDLDQMEREELIDEIKKLRNAIRQHRDCSLHDLCWRQPSLWGLLPEKTDPIPVVPEWPEFIKGCVRYRQSLDEQAPSAPRSDEPYKSESAGDFNNFPMGSPATKKFPEKFMTDTTFAHPVDDRYFEDYVPGSVHEFGPILVEQDEVISFAKRFDPQDFHADPEAAKQTVFGGLIASGWHTAGLMMRLFVDNYLSKVASLSSPGVDELRWSRPVRPRRNGARH